MSDALSFAELDGLHLELLPARTVLSTVTGNTGGAGGEGGTGGITGNTNGGGGTQINSAANGFGGDGGRANGGSANGGAGGGFDFYGYSTGTVSDNTVVPVVLAAPAAKAALVVRVAPRASAKLICLLCQ